MKNLWVLDPIPFEYALRLCNVDKYSLFSFSDQGFLGFIQSSPQWDFQSPDFLDRLYQELESATIKELVTQYDREDRNKLRSPKKQAWSSLRTKAPFYDRARGRAKVYSVQDALGLAQKVVEALGAPWKHPKRGRPSTYCPKKLACAVLIKHYLPLSFDQLKVTLELLHFDCRQDPSQENTPSVPSKSELHWALDKIPTPYLDEALRLLDERATERHGDLFDQQGLNQFGVDGTASQCNRYDWARNTHHPRLHRTTDRVNCLTRLVTNTVSELSSSARENTKNLTKLLKNRKESGRILPKMEIIGDRDYDAEYNYRYAAQNNVSVTIKPKQRAGRPYKGHFRTKALRYYSHTTYRRRKTAERPFGNLTVRDGNMLHYRRPDMKRKGELLRYIAHNMRAYFMQEAWTKIFQRLSIHPKSLRRNGKKK